MKVDLEAIAQAAQHFAPEYEVFRYYVEADERDDSELDALVQALAAPIIAAIDCKTCANCCRHLQVYLTPEDADLLSEVIPLDQIPLAYDVDGEWGKFSRQPCVFLEGTRCGVYAHRPESCRAYPEFTPDFRWQIGHILGGYGICPIIYHLIEALKIALKW